MPSQNCDSSLNMTFCHSVDDVLSLKEALPISGMKKGLIELPSFSKQKSPISRVKRKKDLQS